MPPPAAAQASAPAQSVREAILDAAERRFADRGYAGASLRDIAAEVGLKNQASIYHYFKNKKALYEATLARTVQTLVPLWQGAGDAIAGAVDGSGAAAAAAFLDSVLDHLEQHPDVARLIERAGMDDDRYARTTVPRLLRPLYTAGLDVLDRAGGPWPPEQLPHVATGLYHLIFGYFANASLLRAVMQDDPYTPEMFARQRVFLRAAVAQLLGIAPAPARPAVQKGRNRR